MHDPRHASMLRGSASTLGTVDETNGQGYTRNQLAALADADMGGLANNFTFVQDAQLNKMIRWTSELVAKIIE